MNLFTNGCSFTWGQGLENPETECYSTRLGNLLSANNTVNLSTPGGSNKRIVRTTLDYFAKKIANNTDLSDTIAVIQFTYPDRTEIFEEGTVENWWSILPNFSTVPNAHKFYPFYDGYRNSFYSIFTNEQAFSDFYASVITLGSFFESNQIKYLFLTIENHNVIEIYNTFPNYKTYIKHLGNYNWFKTVETSGMKEMHKYVPVSDTDYHPDKNSHKEYAQIYYNRLKENYPGVIL